MTAPAGSCPSCGRALPSVARFCPGCGAAAAVRCPEPPPQAAPAPESSPEADPLVCPRCGRWKPCPACLCPACMAGEPVPTRPSQAQFRPWKLLWLLGLVVVAMVGKRAFTHSAAAFPLIVVSIVLLFLLRKTLGAGLRVVDRLAPLRPYWRFQAHVPKVLRYLGAIVAAAALSFALTPMLSSMFNGYGFMVFFTALMVNIVVAHFLIGPAPPEAIR